MANIILYKNTSDRRCLNKNLTGSITLSNVTFTTPLNIESWECDIDKSTVDFNQDVYNYCYNSFYPGYYFCKFTQISSNIVHCVATLDPLMSYSAQIKKLTATVDRQENKSNGYLFDSGYSAVAYKQVTTKTFPNAIDNDSIILLTIG